MAGKIGSFRMGAGLGSMKVTEQIDAMGFGHQPHALPCCNACAGHHPDAAFAGAFADAFGIMGGWFWCQHKKAI